MVYCPVWKGQPILPNLLCCQALEVQKYVCVPSASHLWQTWLLHNSGLPFSGFQSSLITDRKRQCNPARDRNPAKGKPLLQQPVTGELLLETICVSPVVFLVFAAWETPGSGAKRRRTGEGLLCCKGLKKTRGESMLEEGTPL